VTALNAWPSFHLGDGTEVDKQIAAPAILALKRGDASAIRSFITSVHTRSSDDQREVVRRTETLLRIRGAEPESSLFSFGGES
jgi:hypothetical protein